MLIGAGRPLRSMLGILVVLASGIASAWRILPAEKGGSRGLPPTPLNQNLFPTGKTEAMVGIPLRFDTLAPGKYRLAIAVSDTATSQSVTLQTTLDFR